MIWLVCCQRFSLEHLLFGMVDHSLLARIEALGQLAPRLLMSFPAMARVAQQAWEENAWFTLDNIERAAQAIRDQFLQPELLERWVSSYQSLPTNQPKRVGLVLAGNIPMVGAHDIISVFLSGHQAMIKASSKDKALITYLIEQLIDIYPPAADQLLLVERLDKPEAIIATGTNSTMQHFRYYFGKYPHILRGHRNSVAVLGGDESTEELVRLGDDVFSYFGMGCRNVAKLLLPTEFAFDRLLEAWKPFSYLAQHNKYKNNLDYQRAIMLMNRVPHQFQEAILLKEDPSPASPIAVLHFEYYRDDQELASILRRDADRIQCVVGKTGIPFGTAHQPALTDYADGVDTMQFLSDLSH